MEKQLQLFVISPDLFDLPTLMVAATLKPMANINVNDAKLNAI
jgi:hypothetical protein